MSSIYKIGENRYRIHVKGAPEYILDKCSSYLDENCEIKNIN